MVLGVGKGVRLERCPQFKGSGCNSIYCKYVNKIHKVTCVL